MGEDKKWYWERRSSGLCTKKGCQTSTDRALCPKHAKRRTRHNVRGASRENGRRFAEKSARLGTCQRCGFDTPVSFNMFTGKPARFCRRCLDVKRWYAASKRGLAALSRRLL
jgi:hypothetical protein